MEQERLLQAMGYFGTPEQFCEAARQMVREAEWELILLMKGEIIPDRQLREWVTERGLAVEPASFLRICYQRGIIDKVPDASEPSWRVGTFCRRFSCFAQYEFYDYTRLPRETQIALSKWQFGEYLAACARGSNFLTLEEALALVGGQPDSIYFHPCSCEVQQYYLHGRRSCVCLVLGDGPNSEPDRGYGERLTAEEAGARLRRFSRLGLLRSSGSLSLCGCDGEDCCPIRMAREMEDWESGSGARYDIDWHPEKCINCGKCTQTCAFGAFRKDKDGLVMYDRELCWGCTLCAPNCPRGAIHLVPRET